MKTIWLLLSVAALAQRAGPDAIVASDGTGHYATVQAAVDAAPANAQRRWLILIKPGRYDAPVHVPRGKSALALVGDDPDRTRIVASRKATDLGPDGAAIGTFRTATVFIEGDDVVVENLTIENAAGPVAQAVALRVEGDRVIVRNSRLLGWQDTLLLNRGRQYLEDTYIAGHVDFIFGAASAYFARCHLHAWRHGYLTAASTPADQAFGFVFADSIVTGEPEVRTYLGRPWRDFAQTVFLRTSMGAAVVPEGWHNWDRPERERTARYAEFGSAGPGALSLERRVSWSRRLSSEEAARLTPSTVLGGADGWNPIGPALHPVSRRANAAPLPSPPGSQASAQAAAVTWDRVLVQASAWYGSAEAVRVAETVVRYQRHTGGWPKNIDMTRPLTDADRARLAAEQRLDDSTIDNDATVTQIRVLARVHAATRDDQFRRPVVKGVEYLLAAQYANGGWPQVFPLRKDYSRHITFNDNAMIGVMTLLAEVASGRPPFAVVEPATRTRAASAVARGHRTVLQTQIRVEGRLTGWCQQYDADTLAPAAARTYEHPSTSAMETAAIVSYLLRVGKPDPATIAAIEGAMAWLDRSRLRGIRVTQRPDPAGPAGFDAVVVADAGGPPVWARFYDTATNVPIFSGRDGVIKSTLAEIEIERRTGYNWYGTWPQALVDTEYPAWKARLNRRHPAP